jgi:hypothetical protein
LPKIEHFRGCLLIEAMQKYDQNGSCQAGVLTLFEQLEPTQLERAFSMTDLGRLYKAIPFKSLAANIPLPKGTCSGLGRKAWMGIEGGIALQVLKHYTRLSDQMIIHRLNADWTMQLFCGIRLGSGRIRDLNLVSAWRVYLSRYLDIDNLQSQFVGHWKPYMEHTHVGMADATAYESRITHPTDVKLLWGSCCWLYDCIMETCRHHRMRRPRINFKGQKQRHLSYQKRRKRSRRKEHRHRKSLLHFLSRLMVRFEDLEQNGLVHLTKESETLRLKTIRTIYYQQLDHLKNPGKRIEGRIVSLHKPYVRPIVRGKETKAVEFGPKAHLLQVDGINFIEHLSYDAFNEGIRLKQAIWRHQQYFGKCHQFAADQIYATNENRKYCSKNGIATCFVRKGRQGAYADQASVMRRELGKQRGTVLEGSFGNEKNHYLLDKIRARNQKTEILWIFFGIMTANAVLMGKRMALSKKSSKAA